MHVVNATGCLLCRELMYYRHVFTEILLTIKWQCIKAIFCLIGLIIWFYSLLPTLDQCIHDSANSICIFCLVLLFLVSLLNFLPCTCVLGWSHICPLSVSLTSFCVSLVVMCASLPYASGDKHPCGNPSTSMQKVKACSVSYNCVRQNVISCCCQLPGGGCAIDGLQRKNVIMMCLFDPLGPEDSGEH